MGKIIGILSLKGGVGKTSSVVSLGASLASFGKKVLIVDANFSAPNLGMHLDFFDPEKTIHHVLCEDVLINEAIYPFKDFFIIPASSYPKKNYDPLKLKEKLDELKEEYDFILIDSSPSLNNETLATMISSDELFVVSTPDYSTLGMTIKAINFSKKQGTPIVGLILNKVHNKNFELTLEEIEKTSNIPVLAVIPYDLNISKSQANFIPPINFKPHSDFSFEFRKLAACLAKEKYEPFRIKEIFQKSFPKRQEINRNVFYQNVF
jgi:chromosome partitioning protein